MKRKIKEDLTGRKFNKWKVLYQADDKIQPSGKHRTMWHCICECGNEKDIDGSSLKSGKSTSCGCVLKQWLVNSNSKINEYDLSGDYRYGCAGIKETKIGKWTAMITADGKDIWLGTFDSKDKAIQARINAENKYFGKFKRE